MTFCTEEFLKEGKHYDVWFAIVEGRVEDAVQLLKTYLPEEKRSWLSIFKKTDGGRGRIEETTRAILLGEELPDHPAPSDGLDLAVVSFPEWIRLLCVLQDVGGYQDYMEDLLEVVLVWLDGLVDEINERSNGYPRNSISGDVWINSFNLRKWCDPLAKLFALQENLVDRANVLRLKTSITLSIMSHYMEEVGPDMIALAGAMEAIGHTDEALGDYKAVVSDFRSRADLIRQYPDEPILRADIVSMEALLAAYEGIVRLEGTEMYDVERAFLEEVIERGVTEEEDEDEDPEEGDDDE